MEQDPTVSLNLVLQSLASNDFLPIAEVCRAGELGYYGVLMGEAILTAPDSTPDLHRANDSVLAATRV